VTGIFKAFSAFFIGKIPPFGVPFCPAPTAGLGPCWQVGQDRELVKYSSPPPVATSPAKVPAAIFLQLYSKAVF